MPLNITQPMPWNSSHAKEPISFGINSPTNGYNWAFGNVVNVDGKAAFENDIAYNTYTTPPPSKLFYTPSGIYAGVIHSITSIGDDGTIYTGTDFISDDNREDCFVLPNLTYKLWYDTATPASGSSISIKPIWKADGTLVVNLSEYIKSTFPSPIPPPVIGTDTNMYRLFSVQIIASDDFEAWCVANALTSSVVILDMTNWNWDDYIWRAIRGVIPHGEFNADYLGGSDVLATATPIVHPEGTLISKIVDDTVVNYTI